MRSLKRAARRKEATSRTSTALIRSRREPSSDMAAAAREILAVSVVLAEGAVVADAAEVLAGAVRTRAAVAIASSAT